MIHVDAKQIFPNYTATGTFAPGWVWDGLRIATLCVWLTVATVLILAPDAGLQLLWGVVVPLVPAIVVIAPGLWRQICPMGFLNQAPRRFGLSFGRTLPARLQTLSFAIAVAIFVVVVSLRQLIFNKVGWATGGLLLLSLAAAFIGGLIYKGRSGWCGTFCPLNPIQRAYGQAPAVNVAQTYCETCVGCQKNCYDFNPQATVFDDIYDEDPQHAGQRRFFMAMIPGFVIAYFAQGSAFAYSYPLYVGALLGASLASVGLYYFCLHYLGFNAYRAASGFAAAALVAFYWFAGPIVVDTVSRQLLGAPAADGFVMASRSVGLIVAIILFLVSRRNERRYEQARAAAEAEAALSAAKPSSDGWEISTPDGVIMARDGQTLLEALLGQDVAIAANCRSGLCGSDAVLVLAGAENLSAPTEDETATARRLGLPANARLACSARVLGPVSISQHVAADTKVVAPLRPAAAASGAVSPARIDLALRRAKPRLVSLDRAAQAGVERVVIIGNGVAGATAADELRKASDSVQIALVSVENRHFYNRMALNKIIDRSATVRSLAMQPPSWHAENRIDAILDTRVVSIDRSAQSVALENGHTLEYDRLILATGARANSPHPTFLMHPNCFVLRNADDAEAMRDYISATGARSAAIIGAGVLGVEAAETLQKMGLGTILLARGPSVMERNIDRQSATLLHRFLDRSGVDVRFNASVRDFVGIDRLEHVTLEDGAVVSADVFLACVGARPNTQLASDCGLDVSRGIVVNPLMMTSDPNIFAIGDCAELPGAQDGYWRIGVAQARTAVAALLGEGERYVEPRAIMRLKSDGIELRSFDMAGSDPVDQVIESPPFAGEWWRVALRDDRIVSAVYAGPPGRVSPIWSLVEANVDIRPYIAQLRAGDIGKLSLVQKSAAA